MARVKSSNRFPLFGFLLGLALVAGLGLALRATWTNTDLRQEASGGGALYVKMLDVVSAEESDQAFVVRLTQQSDISKARQHLQAKDEFVISGTVAKGSNGYNKSFSFTESGNWNWHFVQSSIVMRNKESGECVSASWVDLRIGDWPESEYPNKKVCMAVRVEQIANSPSRLQ